MNSGLYGPRRRLSDRAARGVRELIRRPDDERVEGVAGIESGRSGHRRCGAATWSDVRRFIGARARSGGVGAAAIGDEIDGEVRPLHLRHRLADHSGIVLGQPVLEQGVRHPTVTAAPIFRHEAGRLEPSVEAVPIHLGFDTGQNLVPEVHFACASSFDISFAWQPAESHANFHSFFHRCGKLWGETKAACSHWQG